MTGNRDVIASVGLTALFVGAIIALDNTAKKNRSKEKFSNMATSHNYGKVPNYPVPNGLYGSKANNVNLNYKYTNPDVSIPVKDNNISLATGSQLLDYQLYTEAVNASTPTKAQLDAISGNSYQQTGNSADILKGGVSKNYAPYSQLSDTKGPTLYTSEYAAVNYANPRAQSISACQQNAPSFIATSLLPKPTIPGQNSWDIGAPQNDLANNNYLSAVQQIGVDTVLSSLKNPSYDIRNNIPNPINTVSPWMNSSITPDLQRRPLDCYTPENGLYGCTTGCNTNPTYVGQ